MEVFVIGLGYSARWTLDRLAPRLAHVRATVRRPEAAAALAAAGIEPIPLGTADTARRIEAAVTAADLVLVSAAPDAAGDPLLAAHADAIRCGLSRPDSPWIGYLSTVGVYGDHHGAWVDEATECRPVSQRSIWRLAAERAWSALGAEFAAPVCHLRLAGIYGPGRNAFVNLATGSARRLVKPGQVFNRIHVADIAAAVDAAFAARFDGIVNVADDEPAPPQDVVAEAARLMAVAPPPEEPFDPATLTPMARSFYGENKRVSNRLLRHRLGVELVAPSYREGLARLWNDGTWAGDGRDQAEASPRFRRNRSE
ncbi:MAG: NAD(P)-dependent oxidoreductase [Hyphomicrobiaceae bacterium]|nr:NAD(P)-dependent oxidoreductase [Hyphomicrobiaceae bacterium]